MSTLNTSHPSPTAPPSSSAAPSSACAACKYQRRKCTPDCTLAPFFPADKQRQFLNVHRLFGVSNIHKILKAVDRNLHHDAMNSIIFQSNIRAQDPAGGCYRVILDLQRRIEAAYVELQQVLAQIEFIRSQLDSTAAIQPNLLLSPAAGAGVDAIYAGQQEQQPHFYNSYDGPNLACGGFDINGDTIGFGSEELPQQILLSGLSLQQKAESEEEAHVHACGNGESNVSNASTVAAPCSFKNAVKAETSLMEQAQEHDLRSAASFFTLTNCNAAAI